MHDTTIACPSRLVHTVTSAPLQYWDDWMRRKDVRKGRQCVFPEVSRTHTFGEIGNSGGMFYKQHLANMVLNQERFNWTTMVGVLCLGPTRGHAPQVTGCTMSACSVVVPPGHLHGCRTVQGMLTGKRSWLCTLCDTRQDVSYIKNKTYAALMDGWLAAATPIDEVTKDIKAYCALNAPIDEDTSDLYAVYTDEGNLRQLAQKLSPMQEDPRVGDEGEGLRPPSL